MHDDMISYSRQDKEFVNQPAIEIRNLNKEVWTHYSGIFVGEEWWERICIAIESYDNFIFVISPDSLESGYCISEVEQAIKHQKHILPVLYKPPKKLQKIPKNISKLERVDFNKHKDLKRAVSEICDFLDENPK